jgi:hypothetical protein
MARRLGGTVVRITVDEEIFDVRVDDDAVCVRTTDGSAGVAVSVSRVAVQEVLAGRTLVNAVQAGDVRVCGGLRDLVALLDALEAFVHGAVRCDAIAQVYNDFQMEGVP